MSAKTFSKNPGANERHRHISCIVCGADRPKPHWDCGSFGFVRCAACGHVYQNPQPMPDDLVDRYDEEYSSYEVENSENFLDLMLKGLSDVSFFPRVEAGGVDRSLLDVGCATGALLEYAREQGYAVQGVEVCVPAAEYGRRERGVPIAVGTLEEVELGRRYGAAHFSHVIEHVPDPRVFLRQVRDLLVDRGFMVVVTPNTAGLQARMFGNTWRSAIADHVHLFSKRNLRRVLDEEGFEIVASKTWGGLGVGTAPRWIKKPVDALAKRWGFGDVMLFLCRKSETPPA
jgi:2-polyprenyl-3-methyl-5-hydroxy-6-metoxy-1,4-benzoquinol methylase